MAEKDILEKVLMSYADVFADCVNTLAYRGVRRLSEENLQPAPTESFYQGAEGLRNQLCDTSRYLLEEGRIVAQYLIENETELRRKQILRKASYQGGAYRQQLGNGHPAEPPQEAPGRHGLRGGLPERGELPGSKRPEDTAPVSPVQDDGDAHRGQQVHGADRGAHGKGE